MSQNALLEEKIIRLVLSELGHFGFIYRNV